MPCPMHVTLTFSAAHGAECVKYVDYTHKRNILALCYV